MARSFGGQGRQADLEELGTKFAQDVVIVDANGNQITSFGGGTQYAEDAAHSSGDTGTLALVVRQDTATQLAGTDGDYAPLITDANGRLHVNASGVAVPVTDNASTLSVDDGAGSLTVDGTVTAAQATPTSLKCQIFGDDTTQAIDVDASGQLQIDVLTMPTTAVSQSGTWTVQPGNTANTTAWLVGHGKTLKSKTGSASATFTLVAAVASNKIKVYSLSLMTASTTAVTVTFKDGAGGTALGTYILQAIANTNFGIVENVAVPSSLFEGSVNTLLEMAFSGAVSVTYNLRYWDSDSA